jgi:GTP cyclohydrolase II
MEKIQELASASIPSEFGNFELHAFGSGMSDYSPHLALVNQKENEDNSVLVRIHSECITGDLFASKRCDCGHQLKKSLERIGREGGVLLYLRQEGRGIGIINKLKAYNLQDTGMDTAQANEALGFPIDQRDFKAAISILKGLNIKRVKLLTNNPEKIKAFDEFDIDVISREKLIIPPCLENYKYLRTKQDSMGHMLNMEEAERIEKV